MCALVGAVTAVVVAAFTIWQLAILVGWLVTASAALVWIWREVGGLDADGTARVSTREDDSRAAARLTTLSACVVSLGSVVMGLHKATVVGVRLEAALTVAAMAVVVASWLLVHTQFTLRYAHLYYSGSPIGGIDFPGGDPPRYRDFAYVAFTVGMTFQVSDTEIRDTTIRSTLLQQSLLSYLFGTAIIASTINVLAGLIGG